MKTRCVLLALIVAACWSAAPAVDFGYPVAGEPWYFIRAEFTDVSALAKGAWRVSRVSVNGVRVRDFVLYQDGQEVLGPEILGDIAFEVKARFGWQANTSYDMKVELDNPRTKKSAGLAVKVTSPGLKGYWNPDWKNYLSLVVSEENGVDRPSHPVHASIGVLSPYFRSGDEIRVVRANRAGADVAYTEIPCQVHDIAVWNDPQALAVEEKDEKTGLRVVRYQPTTTFGLAFLSDLKARERATYLVFFNNPAAPKPAYVSDLRVTGTGLGKTIENAAFRATLNKKSGVIYDILEKSSKTLLEHKLETNGSIHWNPCVYSPPHAWYHTSDWEDPPFSEVSGPVFYSMRIAAPLPHYPNVLSSVTYHFYAGVPYILAETTIEITDNLFVQALRNGEVVFNKKAFNRAGYRTVAGEVQTIDLTRTRMHPEHAVTLRPDIPWVTFYNEAGGAAFANLYLDQMMTNVEGGPASATQPFVYLQNGPWYYLARGLVYSFGTNNQTRMLPVRKGSVYYERSAFYPFAVQKGQGYADRVNAIFDALKQPLSVMESIETFTESPEGWVVPILTEPFEEGVTGAVGKQKK
jgi:hypothetical protein